jgi:hypothetical protein
VTAPLPCPFCGNTLLGYSVSGRRRAVLCGRCGAEGPKDPTDDSEERANARWNAAPRQPADLKAAEVNGDQRELGASAQPAGAAAAPTGIPAGGQFGSGGPPAGPVERPAKLYPSGRIADQTFPVLGPAWAPREIPWDYVEPHRHQAMVNHRRTLEEIAARGGLDPIELVAVLENRPGRWMGQIEAVDRLNQLLAVFEAARPRSATTGGMS